MIRVRNDLENRVELSDQQQAPFATAAEQGSSGPQRRKLEEVLALDHRILDAA